MLKDAFLEQNLLGRHVKVNFSDLVLVVCIDRAAFLFHGQVAGVAETKIQLALRSVLTEELGSSSVK